MLDLPLTGRGWGAGLGGMVDAALLIIEKKKKKCTCPPDLSWQKLIDIHIYILQVWRDCLLHLQLII